jgi:hypothetical protein
MGDTLVRFWTELVGRLTGPFAFRFVLQPAMGIAFAIRDGVHDARLGRPPYLWSIIHNHESRAHLVEEGFSKVRRVVILGVVMEAAYQAMVLHAFRPFEMLTMVVGLAVLPYLLLRGPVTRIARLWIRPGLHARPS